MHRCDAECDVTSQHGNVTSPLPLTMSRHGVAPPAPCTAGLSTPAVPSRPSTAAAFPAGPGRVPRRRPTHLTSSASCSSSSSSSSSSLRRRKDFWPGMAPAAAAPRPPLRRFPAAAEARGDDVTVPRRSRAAPPLCPHLGRARGAVPGALRALTDGAGSSRARTLLGSRTVCSERNLV